jgi:hypothetical protein
MATVGIALTAELQGLKELRDGLGKVYTNPKKAEILAEAIEKALEPARLRLRETTPLGPTGNLRRAIAVEVRQYPLDGNAVGLLGYKRSGREPSGSAAGGKVRAGPDRAFHQWWLEEGTAQRRVADRFSNTPYMRRSHTRVTRSGVATQVAAHMVEQGQGGYIASSYNKLGAFKFEPTPRPARGQTGHRVQTSPAYPGAFFKKSKTPIVINPMPIGGSTGRPPLQTAWDQTKATVAEYLSRELRIALSDALSSLTQSSAGAIT